MGSKTPITVAHDAGIGFQTPRAAKRFARSAGAGPHAPRDAVKQISHEGLTLKPNRNLGASVYPGGTADAFLTGSVRCRIETAGAPVARAADRGHSPAVDASRSGRI
jgi:hypothetical protein